MGPNPLTWDAELLSYWFSRNPAVFQDSVLRHQEVGRAKDLSEPHRAKCPISGCANFRSFCSLTKLVLSHRMSEWSWSIWTVAFAIKIRDHLVRNESSKRSSEQFIRRRTWNRSSVEVLLICSSFCREMKRQQALTLQSRSQSYEKRLLASSCLSLCVSRYKDSSEIVCWAID
jgi:uncharacterized protein (DUF2132 family)